MVTIKKLQKQIEIEKTRVSKLKEKEELENKKRELSRELFRLKNRGAIATAGKAGRLLKRGARGIKIALEKAAPVLRKQARLIRDQQLRDEAIIRKLKERRKDTNKIRRKPTRRIRREQRVEREPNDNIFGSLSDLGF